MSIGPLVFRVHAIKRMFQRRISKDDVRYVLEYGETLKPIRKICLTQAAWC
jgi:hypothetical protein